MKLSSSNQNKIKEFKRIIKDLEIVSGPDLKEVQGTMDEVIIYKSLQAGRDFIVEDTILKIDGKEVVDIKFNQEEILKQGQKASWIVSLGYNDGGTITVYRGIVNGTIVKKTGEGFGFDPYFLPEHSSKTLAQLEQEGLKDQYSARNIALQKLKNKQYLKVKDIKSIPKWEGLYQNETA